MFMQSFLRFIACISSICTNNGTLTLCDLDYIQILLINVITFEINLFFLA